MFEGFMTRTAGLITNLFPPHASWLGMDRDMRKLLSLFLRVSDPDKQTPASLRRSYRMSTALWSVPTEQSVSVRDEQIAEHLTLRWYESEGDNDQCLVYFHGGGMMLGDLQTHDRFCRRIARKRRMMVVAVDYRLAPEHPFPAGAEDAITAWNHVAKVWQEQGKELRNLGVGGDSAGGYLAAMVCQQKVKPGLSVVPDEMPAWQWLIYPVTDCLDRSSDSYATYGHDLVLTSPLMNRFHDTYVPDNEQKALPEASPRLADAEVFAQLPPAVVITAEFDPLRDQGLAYARQLRGAGLAVVAHHEPKLGHGYISFGGFSDGALLGIDKAISLIDMICLQARRTMPGNVKTEVKNESQQA